MDRAWCQRLKLNNDEPLSSFAFNFNLRRCTEATIAAAAAAKEVADADLAATRAGRPG